MSARLLVTGGAGFIGSHLVDRLLEAGYRVRVLDDLSTGKRQNVDPRAELLVGDVADRSCVDSAMADVSGVFHLAAIASVARANEDWAGTHRINQSGTVNVLDCARHAARRSGEHVPVVYASSAAVYGDIGDQAAHEALMPRPATAYGADKLGSELHAHIGTRIHGVPTLGLRFFNVYGPRQDPHSPYSGVISIFARRVAQAATIVLHGDGGQTRDFVHVADVVTHLCAAMARLQAQPDSGGSALNVCTGRAISVRDLALLLGHIAGYEPAIEYGPARPGDIRHSRGRPDAALAALGVQAAISLEEGLATLDIPLRDREAA